MRRPPRPVGQGLFDRSSVMFSVLQGAGVLLVSAGVAARALFGGLPEEEMRVLTFTTLVIGDLGLILTNRGIPGPTLGALRVRNPALWLVMAGAVVLLSAVIAVPGLRDVFRFGVLHADDAAAIVVASLLALLWLDAVRATRRWLNRGAATASAA